MSKTTFSQNPSFQFDPVNARNQLRKDGWVLIKNVFTADEVKTFREDAFQAAKEGYTEKDLIITPRLSKAVYDERVLAIYQAVLEDTPVYFGDAGFQIASVLGRISHGYHKDAADRINPGSPDYHDDYSIIRMGIYLQDHKHHSEGLMVRTGSHRTPDLTVGDRVNVPSEAGDVILWYLTTSHSGNAKRMKLFSNYVIGYDGSGSFREKLWYRIPNFLVQSSESDRVALFLTFGKDDDHLKRYLEYLKHRQYAVARWQDSKWDESVQQAAEGKNIKLIDMYSDVEGLDANLVEKKDTVNS